MSYLLVTFTILFFFLAWRRLDTAIVLLLFLLPSYQLRFSLLGLPITLLEVMILVCFFVWLLKETEFKDFLRGSYKAADYFANREKRPAYPFGRGIILFLAASFIALAVAHFSNQALGVWKAYFFEPLLVFILVLNRFGTTKSEVEGTLFKRIEIFLWPLIISALAVSAVAIFQKATGLFIVPNFWPRVTGVFTYPNALGLYLGPLVIMMAGYLMALISDTVRLRKTQSARELEREKNCRNQMLKIIFVTVSFVLSLAAVFLARSEGAMVGLLAVIVLMTAYLLFYNHIILRRAVYVLTELILLFVILSPLFFLKIVPEYAYPDFGNTKLNEAYDKLTLKDFSGEVRKQQWRETFMMMKDGGRWFFGTGLSGYQAAIKPYHQEGIYFNAERDPDFRRKIVLFDQKYRSAHWRPVEIYMYPHNLILNFWTEMGLLGVLAFIFLVGSFFRAGYLLFANDKLNDSKEKFILLGMLGAMMVLVVHGIVDVPFYKNDLAVIFFCILGVIGFVQVDKNN